MTATRSTARRASCIDGHLANLIIVAAKTDGGTSLFAVDGDASGLTRTSLSTMDQTRKQAKLELQDVPGTLIGAEGDGTAVLDKAFDLDRRRPRRRAGRRRPEGARDGRRVRQGARPVRPPDRLVPGHQAQVRRHAARGRVGQVGRLLRPVVRRRSRTTSCRRSPRWPRPTARRRTSTPPPRTSRSTAASASRGSTRRTSTSSGPRAPSCCSATRRTTARSSPSASASDRTGKPRVPQKPPRWLTAWLASGRAGPIGAR